MSGLSELHLCVDRFIPDSLRPAASSMESAVTDAADILSRLPELGADDTLERARAAIVTAKRWTTRGIKCRFLDGDSIQRERVEEKAHQWENHADVRFQFVDTDDEHIRISFSEEGSWSAVGTDALNAAYFPKHQPTMNYGWLDADTDDDEYERVVVHEFGHALGLIHEHQTPAATALKWNVDEVYRVFSGPPNYWSKADIDHNVLQRYSAAQTQYSVFDRASIMLYSFPGSLFTDGVGTPSNTTLSPTDITFIGQVYGQPSSNGGGEPRVLRVTTPYMRGGDVEDVQRYLNEEAYGPIAEDGVYGPNTANAVRRFQQAKGLQVDGIVGPATRAAMALVHA
jgi:Putative peptidoglycan binding domain/Matrixin